MNGEEKDEAVLSNDEDQQEEGGEVVAPEDVRPVVIIDRDAYVSILFHKIHPV